MITVDVLVPAWQTGLLVVVILVFIVLRLFVW